MSRTTLRPLAVALAIAASPLTVVAAPQTPAAAKPATAAPTAAVASLVGAWTVVVSASSGPVEASLQLRADAKDPARVTGTIASQMGESPLEGRFADGALTFGFSMSVSGQSADVSFTGRLQKDGSLAGTMSFGTEPMPWTATKVTPPLNVAGRWVMALDIQGTVATPGLELKIDDGKVTGFYEGRYGKFPITGTLKGRTLEFFFTMDADGTAAQMSFHGEVAADGASIKGTAMMEGMGEVSWSAARPKG